MKKLIALFALVCVMGTAAVAMNSCNNNEKPNEQGGEVKPTEHQHSLTKVDAVPATCEEAGTESYYKCSGCAKLFADAEGKTEIKAPATSGKLGHSFTSYESDDNATCTADGTKTADCDRCDETDTVADEGSKLGHSYTSYESDDNATCTADGTKTADCDRCDETDTVADEGSKLGHSYTEKIEDEAHLKDAAANCQSVNTYWYDCSRCDSISSEDYFESTTAGDHSVSPNWTTEDGKHFHKCTVEGCSYAKDEEACSDADNDNDHLCDVCKAEAGTHTFGTEWVKDEASHWHVCNCGEKSDVAAHVDEDPLNHECDVCEKVVGEHSYTVEEVNELTLKTAANCTEAAVYYKSCACGAISDSETFENGLALGHSYTSYVSDNNATCTEDGTKTADCDRCDEKETIEDKGSAKGHAYGTDWTSDADGHWYVCANVCGTKGSYAAHTPNIDAATEYNSKICTICQYVIEAALGHTTHRYTVPQYDEYYHWNKCYGCNEIDEKVEHTYTETVINAATCTASGEKMLACTCGYSKNETVPALGHDEISHEAKAPTCLDIGYDAYVTCSRCDYTTYAEISAKGHSIVKDNAVAATCTDTGLNEGEHCENCDYKVEQTVVDALGHDEISHEAQAPTCTAIGWDAYVTCSRCDYTTYNEISALGHSYGEWTIATAPTYEADGSLSKSCGVCSDVQTKTLGTVSADNGYTLVITGVLSRWTCEIDGQTFTFDIIETVDTTDGANTYSEDASAWYVDFDASGNPMFKEGYKNVVDGSYDSTNLSFGNVSEKLATYTTTVYAPNNTTVTLILNCARNKAKPFYSTTGAEHVIGWISVNDSSDNVIYDYDAKLTVTGWHEYTDYAIATLFLKEGENVISFKTATTVNVKGIGFISTEEIHMYQPMYTLTAAPTYEAEGVITKTNTCTICGAVQSTEELAAPVLSEENGYTLIITGVLSRWQYVCDYVTFTIDVVEESTETYESSFDAATVFVSPIGSNTSTLKETYFGDTSGDTFTTKFTVSKATTVKFIIIGGSKGTRSYSGATIVANLKLDGSTTGVKLTTDKTQFAGWTNFVDFYAATLFLDEGTHTITFKPTANLNIRGIKIVATTDVHVCSYEIDEAIEATCISDGLTEGMHCSTCNAVIVAQEIIPASGHSYAYNVTAEPTEDAAGSYERVCTLCADTLTGTVNSYEFDANALVGDKYGSTTATHDGSSYTGVAGDEFSAVITVPEATYAFLVINGSAAADLTYTGSSLVSAITVNGYAEDAILSSVETAFTGADSFTKINVAALLLDEGTNRITFTLAADFNIKDIIFYSVAEVSQCGESLDLNLMSFNIRQDTDSGVKAWSSRKDAVVQLIIDANPSVVCFQEVKKGQYNDLAAGLTDYTVIYYGRGGSTTEGLAIAYKTSEWTEISRQRFWLSETPDVESMGWGASYLRICVNVLLQHNETGEYLNVFTVHLDFTAEPKQKGMELIVSKAKEMSETAGIDYPVYIAGDYNDEIGGVGYSATKDICNDTRFCSYISDHYTTGSKWGEADDTSTTTVIDHCFVSKNHFVSNEFDVIRERDEDNFYPSDHFAVIAKVSLLLS